MTHASLGQMRAKRKHAAQVRDRKILNNGLLGAQSTASAKRHAIMTRMDDETETRRVVQNSAYPSTPTFP